jgi:hypothetical protein
MGTTQRKISRAKTYGFHPWRDQVDAIDKIVEETSVKESIVLRKLIDEALIARHRKIAEDELGEAASGQAVSETLQTIQNLLLKLVRQGQTSLRMQDVSLALLQDTLAEARAGRRLTWEQTASTLKEQGLNAKEITKRFDAQTEEAKDFAYGAAQEIKSQQER